MPSPAGTDGRRDPSPQAPAPMGSDRGPIVSILKKPQQGKAPFLSGNRQKGSADKFGFVATLDKMTKYQRACHDLEKLKNATEEAQNFMDGIKNSNAQK